MGELNTGVNSELTKEQVIDILETKIAYYDEFDSVRMEERVMGLLIAKYFVGRIESRECGKECLNQNGE